MNQILLSYFFFLLYNVCKEMHMKDLYTLLHQTECPDTDYYIN